MQIDKKTVRNLLLIVAGGIVFYWLLNKTEQFRSLWASVIGMVSPFVVGAAMAFILNVPMRAIERQLGFIQKDGLRRTMAILLTLVAVVMVIVGVVLLLVPQITETIQSLLPKLTAFFQRIGEQVRLFLT